jgi:hypothetical protein
VLIVDAPEVVHVNEQEGAFLLTAKSLGGDALKFLTANERCEGVWAGRSTLYRFHWRHTACTGDSKAGKECRRCGKAQDIDRAPGMDGLYDRKTALDSDDADK